MKSIIIAVAPVLLLIWVTLCYSYGIILGTLACFILIAVSAALTWWVVYVMDHFN